MRLLLDENLSPRHAIRLQDIFQGSQHIRDVSLLGARDIEIWRYAAQEGFVILTKDADFESRGVLEGGPPKVILVRLGNCSTRNVEIVIRNSLAKITGFDADSEAAVLVIP